MRIEADFTTISTEFTPIPAADEPYSFVLEEIEEGQTKGTPPLPQLIFKSKVTQGEHVNRMYNDYVVLKTKEGKANAIGLGRVKAYAEAILGKEKANGSELNTDDLKGGSFLGLIKADSYEKDGKTVPTTRLVKILPA